MLPPSLSQISFITKEFSSEQLEEFTETDEKLTDWEFFPVVQQFLVDNNIDLNAIQDLQEELDVIRKDKIIMYDTYLKSDIFYEVLREVLEYIFCLPEKPPHDSRFNIPFLDKQFDKFDYGYEHRDLLERIMSDWQPDTPLPLDNFTVATRLRNVTPCLFFPDGNKWYVNKHMPTGTFTQKLERLPVTQESKIRLIDLFNKYSQQWNEKITAKNIYKIDDLEILRDLYPNPPFEETDSKYGIDRSVIMAMQIWVEDDEPEPISFYQTGFFWREYPEIEQENIESLREEIINLIPNSSSQTLLPSSLLWLSFPNINDSLINGKIEGGVLELLRNLSDRCCDIYIAQAFDEINPIHIAAYHNNKQNLKDAEIIKRNVVLQLNYADMTAEEKNIYLKRESDRFYDMFLELIKIEIERSKKGMLTVYHCRDLSMKFFDLVSQVLGKGKFNKLQSGYKGNAFVKYSELKKLMFSKYPIKTDFRDTDPDKFQFFDGAPEAALYLTSCSYTMMSNFGRHEESSIQLLIENRSVSDIKKKFDKIIRNFGLDDEINLKLAEIFIEFSRETSEKVRESPKYMGQLISIGIPVKDIDNYGYDAYEGGLMKTSTSGSIKQQLGSWPLSLIKPGISNEDCYDINSAQCRLIDVDFNDKSLDIQYFEDFPIERVEYYLDKIREIF